MHRFAIFHAQNLQRTKQVEMQKFWKTLHFCLLHKCFDFGFNQSSALIAVDCKYSGYRLGNCQHSVFAGLKSIRYY